MTAERDARTQATIEFYEAVVRTLKSESMAHWVDLDLTTAQLKVLFSLEYGGPATIGQVAEHLAVSLPTASHLVDRLVQAGLVERAVDPADRRRTVARPSEKGSELVRRLREGGRQRLACWLHRLEEKELEAVHHGLAILARAAGVDRGEKCRFDHGDTDRQSGSPATIIVGS